MATTIVGIAHFTFHDGGLEEFRRLTRRCREIVASQDTGTLRYDVFVDEDQRRALVLEEYGSEHALVEHGRNIGDELSAAVLATAEVHGELLGDLSPGMREQLRGGPVTAYTPADV